MFKPEKGLSPERIEGRESKGEKGLTPEEAKEFKELNNEYNRLIEELGEMKGIKTYEDTLDKIAKINEVHARYENFLKKMTHKEIEEMTGVSGDVPPEKIEKEG